MGSSDPYYQLSITLKNMYATNSRSSSSSSSSSNNNNNNNSNNSNNNSSSNDGNDLQYSSVLSQSNQQITDMTLERYENNRKIIVHGEGHNIPSIRTNSFPDILKCIQCWML